MKKQSIIKSLQVLHKTMLLGQVLFAAIVFFLKYTDRLPSGYSSIDQVLQVIAILLSAGGFFVGTSLFNKRVNYLRNSTESLETKSVAYRSASLLQWALLEGPSLFCILCFMLAGNYAFLALAVVLMMLLFMAAPSRLKIMLLLRLSEEEMENF